MSGPGISFFRFGGGLVGAEFFTFPGRFLADGFAAKIFESWRKICTKVGKKLFEKSRAPQEINCRPLNPFPCVAAKSFFRGAQSEHIPGASG